MHAGLCRLWLPSSLRSARQSACCLGSCWGQLSMPPPPMLVAGASLYTAACSQIGSAHVVEHECGDEAGGMDTQVGTAPASGVAACRPHPPCAFTAGPGTISPYPEAAPHADL